MDDVLCDFELQFKKQSGGLNGHQYRQQNGRDKFHEIINNAGEEFWSEMPWMPGGKDLWRYIGMKGAEILSAPMTDVPMSITGKKKWVVKNLGRRTVLYLSDPPKKQLYSNDRSILIDDRADTIAQWNSRGGIGIQHTSAPITIGRLKQLFGDR